MIEISQNAFGLVLDKCSSSNTPRMMNIAPNMNLPIWFPFCWTFLGYGGCSRFSRCVKGLLSKCYSSNGKRSSGTWKPNATWLSDVILESLLVILSACLWVLRQDFTRSTWSGWSVSNSAPQEQTSRIISNKVELHSQLERSRQPKSFVLSLQLFVRHC